MNWALSSQLPIVGSAAGETSCSCAPAHIAAGHRTQDTGHRTQDTGHRTQDTGHRIQDSEYKRKVHAQIGSKCSNSIHAYMFV